MVLASAIVSVIPYIGIISMFVLWTISTCLLQAKINKLIALGPVQIESSRASSPLKNSVRNSVRT